MSGAISSTDYASAITLRLLALAGLFALAGTFSQALAVVAAVIVFIIGSPHGTPETTGSGPVAPGVRHGILYVLFAIGVGLAWWINPLATLFAFFAAAALHFAEDDPALWMAGPWVVFGPFLFQSDATVRLAEFIVGASLAAPGWLGGLAGVILFGLVIEVVRKRHWLYGISLLLIGALLPPVLSIAAYYGAVHAWGVWSALPREVTSSPGFRTYGALAVLGGLSILALVLAGVVDVRLAIAGAIIVASPHVIGGIVRSAPLLPRMARRAAH